LVMLIWKPLPWNGIISLQALKLVNWKDIIWLSSRHSMVYARLDYAGTNASLTAYATKVFHLARQNLISGWDSMAICTNMWPRMLTTFALGCWTRNHSRILNFVSVFHYTLSGLCGFTPCTRSLYLCLCWILWQQRKFFIKAT
jgi:hypothetical protein